MRNGFVDIWLKRLAILGVVVMWKILIMFLGSVLLLEGYGVC